MTTGSANLSAGKLQVWCARVLESEASREASAIALGQLPADLFARIQEIGDLGHGVPAKAPLRLELRRVFQPVLNFLAIGKNPGRVKIDEPHLLVADDEVGQRLEPLLDDREGNILGAELFEGGGPVQLSDGKSPDVLSRCAGRRDSPAWVPCRRRP